MSATGFRVHEPSGVADGDVDTAAVDSSRAPQPVDAGDAMPDLAEVSQSVDIDMDQFSEVLLIVAMVWGLVE